MIREPYNLNPYNSTIDTSKVNNFSFTFSGDELGSWNIEIAKNNTSPEIVYTSEEFVPEDMGYTHIYDGDIVEGITLPSTIAHSQSDDGLLRRLYSINGYPFNAAVVKLNVNGIENIGNIKGSTANGYLVATNYSLGRTGSNVTIIGFDRDGTTIGSQVTDGTYDFLGYLLSVKENSNIEVGQVVQIGGNSFVIGNIEDVGDGYSELTIVNGEATSSDVTPILTFDSLAEADVTELTVGIEPVQDLSHGDPSPTNICPITGHDEVGVFFGAEQGTADETYTTSLGQTVYGGTLDMVSGVLTVDKGYYKVTDVSQILGSGSQSGTYPKWVLALNNLPNVDPSYYGQFWERQDAVISNMGIMVRESVSLNTDETTMSAYFHAKNVEIRLRPLVSEFPTLEEAKQVYVGAEFVYPIVPTTYQLTPQQIKTLVGTNNVWASSGDIVSIKFTYETN